MSWRLIFQLLTVFSLGCANTFAAERPNVLFILSDDLRPELGCYGAPVHTPEIDRLAARSMRFERAYCQYPLCNPSRASMLTGLQPTQTGVLDNSENFRAKLREHATLPQLFKQNGYTTLGFGKVFHGGIEDPISWSEAAAKPLGKAARARRMQRNRQPIANAQQQIGPNDRGLPFTPFAISTTQQIISSDRRIVLPGDGERHADHLTASATIAAIERLKNEPFFIACGFTKPHAPPTAPQRFFDLYSPEQMQLPPDFGPSPKPPAGFPGAALSKNNIDLFWNREATAPEARLMLQAYRASVSWVDWNVGRVLAELDRCGLRDNTIVVLWGDHGYHLGEMGKWSKHNSLFEVGARVPLLISAPGAAGMGQACESPVQSVDIYPTLAALCGLEKLPTNLAGHNLRPLLEEPTASWGHPAYTVAKEGANLHRAVRVDQYRYIEWSGPQGGAALIDEAAGDPTRCNLIDDPTHHTTVERMKALLEQLPRSSS